MAAMIQFDQDKGCPRVKGFTLVELLIVVSIMGLLLALTVPAFVDIGRGSRMSGAVSQLTSTLQLARQWAITQREEVSIVFPDDWAALYGGNTNHYPKALRSYAVYTPSKGYLTDWRYLPEGVFFVDTHNTQNAIANNLNLAEVDANNNLFNPIWLRSGYVKFPTATSSQPPIYTLTYMPDGTVQSQGVKRIEIYMAEAVKLEGTAGKVVNLVWKGNPVMNMISIRPFTGVPQVVDFTRTPGSATGGWN